MAEVADDESCAPFLDFARSVPFTSVLSAPLVASDGGAWGVVSVQSKQRFVPSELELAALKDFTTSVADRLAAGGTRHELTQLAAKMADEIQPDGLHCDRDPGADSGPGAGPCGSRRA